MNLEWAWNKIKELWHNPYYLWLYGSQNYNLDTEKSDFDYKCIILPSLEDLVKQTKPVSETIEFEGWQIDLKDIRVYIDSAVKVNINFIEILNTDYCLWNLQLRKAFTPLLKELWNQYLRCCFWMIEQKYHALEHPYPSKEYEIKTYWYDPKQLCHIVRLFLLMVRYLEWNYSFKHVRKEREWLLKLKSWKLELWEARRLAKEYRKLAKELVDKYKWVDTYVNKKLLVKMSKNIIIDNIRKNENLDN